MVEPVSTDRFQLSDSFHPSGDQPEAIRNLAEGVRSGCPFQTLLGVTGSGKTFTIANVIAEVQRPALVIAHNKTLAAQLVQEFRFFFPKNAVEYFVSYYDYYQPEAYVASTDTYIEKETQINEEIDRLRHSATASVLSRRDVIIVASVSCIYGLGSPEYYKEITLPLSTGDVVDRKRISKRLVEMYYQRSEVLARGRFRMRGNAIEIMSPAKERVTRIETENGIISRIVEYDFVTGEMFGERNGTILYPAKHFVVPEPIMQKALVEIEKEMRERMAHFRSAGKLLEAERIELRTKQDLEMMREIGYCNGIENYSRHLTGRKAGEAPSTLLDYFPKDFLLIIDESHVAIPQISGMYNGDRSRKAALVENGFRLPSAMDNRPLRFEEFESRIGQTIFTSATPGNYEAVHSKRIAEQIIRPTGLVDPEISVRPVSGQVADLLGEIRSCIEKNDRILVTTLTKKMAEDLSDYFKEQGVKAEYLHSSVDTLDRVKILENLRRGKFDVLVGVNLLREGLDLPEVALVAVLDADKEGFLRSETSLIQTIGRAARNVRGKVILYGDAITGSMKRAIEETERRRTIQLLYNRKHHITPKTIQKNIASIVDHEVNPAFPKEAVQLESLEDIGAYIKLREKAMRDAAKQMKFEEAAVIRDEIQSLKRIVR